MFDFLDDGPLGNNNNNHRGGGRDGTNEQRLLNYLFRNYDTDARGVMNSNETVSVSLTFLLLRIQSLVSKPHINMIVLYVI